MKCLLPTLLLALAACLNAQMDLHQYRWKNRVLIVLGPEADQALQEQLATDQTAKAGFDERQLITLLESDPNGPLHKRFAVPGKEFRVILVGKDGHAALTRSQPIASSELFRVIDSMPMRQAEMKRAGTEQ